MSTKTLTLSLDDNHEFRILDNENNQDRRISSGPPDIGEPQTFEELQQRWGLWLVESVLSAIMEITGHKSLTCKVPDHHWIANRGLRCVNQLSLALGKRAHEKQEPRISAHISQLGNMVLFSVVVPVYEAEGGTEYAHIWAGASINTDKRDIELRCWIDLDGSPFRMHYHCNISRKTITKRIGA